MQVIKILLNDWFKVLKQYDFNDMTDSLDYYMQNYTEYPPKVYNLIKGIKQQKVKRFWIMQKQDVSSATK